MPTKITSRNRRIHRRQKFSNRYVVAKYNRSRNSRVNGTLRTPKSNAWNAGPFPRQLRTKLPYFDNKAIATLVGVPTPQHYRLNSVYDPDYTGTGISAMYVDQLLGNASSIAPYYKYRVNGAKWQATVYNGNSTSASVCRLTAIVNPGAGFTPPTTFEQALMSKGCIASKPIGILTGSDNCKTISGYVNMKKYLGSDFDESDAAYNANPPDLNTVDICFQIWPLDEGTTTLSMFFSVKITYYVTCFNTNVMTIS